MPKYIRKLKAIWVNKFKTWVKDPHTTYYSDNGFKISPVSMYEHLRVEHADNPTQFKHYLAIPQKGETDCFTFCKHYAESGIEK